MFDSHAYTVRIANAHVKPNDLESPQTNDKNAVRGRSIRQWEAATLEFESHVIIHKPNGHWEDAETKGTAPGGSTPFLPDTYAPPAARTAHIRFPLLNLPCVAEYIALAAQRDAPVRHALSACRLTKQEIRALFNYETRSDMPVEYFPRIEGDTNRA